LAFLELFRVKELPTAPTTAEMFEYEAHFNESAKLSQELSAIPAECSA